MADIYNPNPLDVPRVNCMADEDNLLHAIKTVFVVSAIANSVVQTIKEERKKKKK